MKQRYRIPWHNRWNRMILVPIFKTIFRLLSHVELIGFENIPRQGPYILVFNHVSIFDPPFVIAFWPVQPEILGAIDIWSRPGQASLARFYGAIPIRRGEVDRDAMERMLNVLRSGFPLMISPEGTRSHQPGLQQAKPGIVYVIESTKAPIVPVSVTGTTDDFFKSAIRREHPHLIMRVGEAFTLPDIHEPELSPKEIRQKKVDFIMNRLAELLPTNYQGFYAPPEAPRAASEHMTPEKS